MPGPIWDTLDINGNPVAAGTSGQFINHIGGCTTPPAGGNPPTGTGFRHVTNGVEDAAAAAVAPADVTGTAVVTADSRLSDARTPTAHATSHMGGGSDEVGGLPIFNKVLALDETIGANKRCNLFGGITISSGTITISGNGELNIFALPRGIQ